jgi:O-acetyl-ADP-ribose deacetylase (regulator of RNase III)
MMKIVLCDTNQQLVEAWKLAFQDLTSHHLHLFIPSVEVYGGSIFDYDVDALVSPANSFGFMDGGFDYLLSQVLGWGVQTELQRVINNLPERELLVGRTLTVETNHSRWPYLISAPTMRVPMYLGSSSVNVYLAALAIFNELKQNPNISSIGMTGLGTGVGKVPVDVCAHQMRKAYDVVFIGHTAPKTWHEAQASHQSLCLSRPRDLQQDGN